MVASDGPGNYRIALALYRVSDGHAAGTQLNCPADSRRHSGDAGHADTSGYGKPRDVQSTEATRARKAAFVTRQRAQGYEEQAAVDRRAHLTACLAWSGRADWKRATAVQATG